MRYLICTLLFLTFCGGFAQNSNCNTPYHHQFNFWIGSWDVYDTLNNFIGENTIEKVENNCVLSEKWKSKTGFSGRSLNYFDFNDSTWNQLWVDGAGNNLKLKGSFKNNIMTLKSAIIINDSSGNYYNQISWFLQNDGSVVQTWLRVNELNEKLSEVFKGVYKKKIKH